eukprot:2436375-Karenia_brevis.AAC.1
MENEQNKGRDVVSHPVPPATLPITFKYPKNGSVGTPGDCGVSAGVGRPVVDCCSHHNFML